MLMMESLSEQVIGAAIEVHRNLGPGLLESAYEECLCYELKIRRLAFERQRKLTLNYKGHSLDAGYRLDLVVKNKIILELKCVERIMPVHEAQLLTYLKLSGFHLGFLFNFNTPLLKDGMCRIAL